jgi:hypothetical protein
MKMKEIKINNPLRIAVYDAQAAKVKKDELRKKNARFFRSWKRQCKFEKSRAGLHYQVFAYLLELKAGDYYIQVDNRPTFWTCWDSSDGLIIHKNLTGVKLIGRILTIFYDGKIERYAYYANHERFGKLLIPEVEFK